MYDNRPPSYNYLDYVYTLIFTVASFIASRILNQVLDRYNILTLKQFADFGYKSFISFYAISLRLDRILMILCLRFGLYRFANIYLNSMRNDFQMVLYLAYKTNPTYSTMKDMFSDKKSRYWTNIIQLDKLTKCPLESFVLIYPLVKHVRKNNQT